MFHHESWLPIYFGVKGSFDPKVNGTKKTLPACVMALLRVLAFSTFYMEVLDEVNKWSENF